MTVKNEKNGENRGKYGEKSCLILDTERISTAMGPNFGNNLEDI